MKFVIAIGLLIALSFVLLWLGPRLKLIWSLAKFLIALDTPAANLPCPYCGCESTIFRSYYVCDPCDVIVGPVRV